MFKKILPSAALLSGLVLGASQVDARGYGYGYDYNHNHYRPYYRPTPTTSRTATP